MSNQTDLKFVKLPFFLCAFGCDVVLVAFAYYYLLHSHSPLSFFEGVLLTLCVIAGAAVALLPFLLEYRAAVKMVETGAVVSTISQVQNIEEIARQITGATAQWQGVQEHCSRATTAVKAVSERMASEVATFGEFLQQSNDSEKATLRLEIEKLRRTEGDWVHVIVRMLDHTFALHQAAVRSGQPDLVLQLGNFQNACRDVARRVGLVPFAPAVDERFDPQCHQSSDSQVISVTDAKIRETIAAGYTYQGRLLRPALVSLQNPPPASVEVDASEPPATLPEENVKAAKTEVVMEEPTLL